ncbi:MAG TPA: hypothetical protein VGC57_04300 [Cellulomonas sp.]
MATLSIGGLTIESDDGTVRTLLEAIQYAVAKGETKLVRLPEGTGVDDLVVAIGPGIPVHALLASGTSILPVMQVSGPIRARL